MIELLKSHISPNQYTLFMWHIRNYWTHVLGRQRESRTHGEAGERTMTFSIGLYIVLIIPMLAGFNSETWHVTLNVVTGIGFIGAGVFT